jgi:hypothetical protein
MAKKYTSDQVKEITSSAVEAALKAQDEIESDDDNDLKIRVKELEGIIKEFSDKFKTKKSDDEPDKLKSKDDDLKNEIQSKISRLFK